MCQLFALMKCNSSSEKEVVWGKDLKTCFTMVNMVCKSYGLEPAQKTSMN